MTLVIFVWLVNSFVGMLERCFWGISVGIFVAIFCWDVGPLEVC